jgi:hypothetical protein
MMLFVLGACVLWFLLCTSLWWRIGPKHPYQRRFIALAAALGAAMIYNSGGRIVTVLQRFQTKQEQNQPSGDDVHIKLRR